MLTFGPSDTKQCFNVSYPDDNIALEPPATITFTIATNDPKITTGDNVEASAMIIDDDRKQ